MNEPTMSADEMYLAGLRVIAAEHPDPDRRMEAVSSAFELELRMRREAEAEAFRRELDDVFWALVRLFRVDALFDWMSRKVER